MFEHKKEGRNQMLRTHKLPVLLVAWLSTLMLIVSACGGPSSSSTTANSGKPVHGGTLIDALYEQPDSMIPNGSSGPETFAEMVQAAIWTPLFYGDDHLQVHPGLAAEVPTVQNGGISADGLTYTIHLRSGLKWSDGQPITSHDVDFSWRLWMNPKFTPSSTLGFDHIASADTPNDTTIVFHLSKPFSPFLSVWTDYDAPMPAHVFQNMDPSKILTSSQNLVPTVSDGPFTVKSNVKGQDIICVRNPNYYQKGLPYLNEVDFKIIPDQNTILTALEGGQIDTAWFLNITEYNSLTNIPGYKFWPGAPVNINYEAVYPNLQNPILADVRVRQALYYGINRESMIQSVWHGLAKPITSDYPNTWADAHLPVPPYDPQKADQLLSQAGWVMGSDGYRHKNGQILELTYSTTAATQWRSEDEQIVQSNLKQVGMKIDIKNYPADTFFGTILPGGKFDLAEFENNLGYDPDNKAIFGCHYTPPNGSNFGHYCNPQLDAILNQSEATPSQAARKPLLAQEQQILLNDAPIIYLYSPPDIAEYRATVHNYMPEPGTNAETWNIWEWWKSSS
jgi:peptide/nickel transport system substrate-binding protein